MEVAPRQLFISIAFVMLRDFCTHVDACNANLLRKELLLDNPLSRLCICVEQIDT